MTNFHLYDAQTVNRLRKIAWAAISRLMSPCLCLHVLQKENGTNRKRQLPFVFCKPEKEIANFRLFAAIRNGKRKFVSLDQQMNLK
jgi:hypothetical protein